MVKIKSIKREKYNGLVYDLSICDATSPYFYANRILTHNSLYPHIMIQCNLYGRNKKSPSGWHGGKMWELEGYYHEDTLSPVGKLLRAWYHLRLQYKRQFFSEDGLLIKMSDAVKHIGKKYYKVVHDEQNKISLEVVTMTEQLAEECVKLAASGKDRREYTIKIIINTIYGILNNAYYQLVYDLTAGGDCTRLGRQWVKYARKVFRDAGYKIIYTDTDSWYVLDHLNNKEKILEINKQVIDAIKASVPFPQMTFDAGIDAEIKYMFFFKGVSKKDKDSDKEMDSDDVINKPLGLMKKNYIYVEHDNSLTIKNLGIKKKNISALSKEVFWKHMVPKITSEGKIKFDKTEIDNLFKKLLSEDIKLAHMRRDVKELSAYTKSPNGIQAQTTRKYGSGIHFLIPNRRGIGVGKKVKYCSTDDFEKYQMNIGDIDFSNFWKEINYFVKERKMVNLFSYGGEL